jgi:AGZA family xanthine/uracil permease-like MFS transporter
MPLDSEPRWDAATVRREVLAGLTTFMTMAYIIAVNPIILGNPKGAAMPMTAVMTATCLASGLTCILMGIVARYPFALAPGMGINAYFSFTVAAKYGWDVALGAVFLSGVVFLVLTLVRVRELLIDAVPAALKHSVAAGIGLFIALIGFQSAGLVVPSPSTMVTSFAKVTPPLEVALFGLVLTIVLILLRLRGAILIGIVAATVLGLWLGIKPVPGRVFQMPDFGLFGRLNVVGALHVGLFEIIFAFLFVSMFDAVGTVIGLADRAGFLRQGKLPRATRVLLADSAGNVIGSLAGTSTVTAYIESAAGIEEGGRTGLTAVTVGVLFLLAMFFSPIVEAIPEQATSAALIVVGAMMMGTAREIDWTDPTEFIPAFLVMIAMPFFYSIAQGIALGFIFYPVAKLVTGRWREAHWLVYILGLLFIVQFIVLKYFA